MVGMLVGDEYRIEMIDVGRQHLGAQIGRGVDEHSGRPLRPMAGQEQRTSEPSIARVGGIASAPLVPDARDPAG